MRYFYKSPNGEVYEYASVEERNTYGAPDLVAMTQEEIDAHLSNGGIDPQPPTEEEIRAQRDVLLISIYDKGINMALRALRLAVSPEDLAYAEGKIAELDAYAEALTSIPEQDGFPGNVDWPETPRP